MLIFSFIPNVTHTLTFSRNFNYHFHHWSPTTSSGVFALAFGQNPKRRIRFLEIYFRFSHFLPILLQNLSQIEFKFENWFEDRNGDTSYFSIISFSFSLNKISYSACLLLFLSFKFEFRSWVRAWILHKNIPISCSNTFLL